MSQKSDPIATPQQQQGYPFHASGDCRSLARFVNVEGTYYTDAAQEQPQSDEAQAKKQTTKDAVSAAGGASTGVRIQGQAQIGKDIRIDINAIAVPLKTKSKANPDDPRSARRLKRGIQD